MAKNTAIGEILSNKIDFNSTLPDPFFDSFREDLLTSHDILDLLALTNESFIKIKFDREFLKRILKSHIVFIRKV